jgi:gluconate 5-dehydrogenase
MAPAIFSNVKKTPQAGEGFLNMDQLFSLKDKVALICGASRGIGWGITQGMAAAGANLVINGRDGDFLNERVAELQAAGHTASAAPFDVTDEAAAIKAVNAVVEEHGRLDILLFNAGTTIRRELADYSTEDFHTVVDTNMTAAFVLAREASRPMRRNGWGRIIVVSSMMGQVARPNNAAYIASKGGVTALCKGLAVELGEFGITCNAICPGFTRTDLTQPLQDNAEFDQWVASRTPLGRWAEPRDIAGAAVFLASDAGAYVTGHALNVDGGVVINV